MLALKRLAAFGIDYVVIVAWSGVLFAVAVLTGGVPEEPSAALPDKVTGHGLAFLTMTLPVWLYFSLAEGLGRHATLGKRVLSLRVDGTLGQAMLRNFLRFLPWEIAHAGIWYVPGRPFLDEMPFPNLAVMVVSMALALVILASVLLGGDRGLHDRLAGTRVVG